MNNNKEKVVIEVGKMLSYPTEEFDYSPSEYYPEYIFSDIATKENEVYYLVRKTLIDMGLDKKNLGTELWNPLGELLKPGQTVIVKPNLVMHENKNKNLNSNELDCLVTHPSCIRAIVDYCVIALSDQNGGINGKIIIADAPMQGCNFNELVSKIHLDAVVKFYKDRGIDIALVDLRQYKTTFNKNKVIVGKEYTNSQGVTVHLGIRSMHSKSNSNGQYRVSDYSKDETALFHNNDIHDYEISEDILESDLLINLCKPKTHRLAGITASLKNTIGITYNKASLPHRTVGAIEEGGDAYMYKNWMKKIAERILNYKIVEENKEHIFRATLMRYCYGIFLVLGRLFGKDNYYIGSWYGNDTIWRTIIDLNYAVEYASEDGELYNESQRKILYLADMVIAGEHNGPVSPEPKELGVICGALDGFAMDSVICRMMGFETEKIPYLKAILHGDTWIKYMEPIIVSNIESFNGSINSVVFPEKWKFIPHDSWKDFLS